MRQLVNYKLLAVIMITGFLFSSGSSYLNQLVFADDPQSDINARMQSSEQRAIEKYNTYYQFANMDAAKRNWAGLNSTETDETSRGRNIDAAAQVSLQNAVAQFNDIHVRQLQYDTSTGYANLTSTETDEQGRVRNDMIASATSTSLVQANDIVNQLVKLQQNYANFAPSTPTDTAATYDRQTMITQNSQTAEAQAASLVSQLAKIDNVFLDLTPYVGTNIPFTYKPGSITAEFNHGERNLTPAQAYSLEKAVMIFNQIHQATITSYGSNYYGLTSTPTDSQGVNRNTLLAQAQSDSLTNALRVYNSYYNGVGLNK